MASKLLFLIFILFSFFSLEKTKSQSLEVDYSKFISDQNLTWKLIPETWDESPFLGNGIHGLMIYCPKDSNYIKLDVGNSLVQDHRNTDSRYNMHDQCRLPIGYFTINPEGKIIDCNLTLDIWNAELKGSFITDKGKIDILAYVHAEKQLIIVELETSENEKQTTISWQPSPAVSPRQSKGRTQDGYVYNPEGAFETKDSTCLYIQPLSSGGETAVAWQIKKSGSTQNLIVNVSHSYPYTNASEKAVEIIEQAVIRNPDSLQMTHSAWWNNFYQKSFLSLPNKKLEKFYWIQLYKLGSATRADGALIDNQGPWLQPTPWPGAWWNLNVQLTYWTCNASNHTDLNQSLINCLYNNIDTLINNVPEQYRYNSAGIGRTSGQIPKSAAYEAWNTPLSVSSNISAIVPEIGLLPWACHNLWLNYRYTMDTAMLREKLFPILKRATNYYIHFLEKDTAGVYHLPYTYSPEYGIAKDCNFDLSLLKWSCQVLIKSCELLSIDDSLLNTWKDINKNLVAFPKDKYGYSIGAKYPYLKSHRHYSHLLMIYPLYLVNADQPGVKDTITSSIVRWHSLPTALRGYSYTGASSLYSAINEGDSALKYIEKLFGEFLTPNTFYQESGPVIETPLSGAQSILDMLIQSWGGKIRVFPAVPSDWKDVSFHKLLAEGGFEVSASLKNGKTEFVKIKSKAGEPCIVKLDIEKPIKIRNNDSINYQWLSDDELKIDINKGDEVIVLSNGNISDTAIKEIVSTDTNTYFGLHPETGIKNFYKSSSINVFPNPTKNELTIEYDIANESYFKLYNITGTKNFSVTLDKKTQTKQISLTNISNGLYFYTICNKSGQRIKTGKLIVLK